MLLDLLQTGISSTALALQAIALWLTWKLRDMLPARLWRVLLVLSFFVLSRRLLSTIEITFDWKTRNYESLAVLIGSGVSVCMLLVLVRLRTYLQAERQRREKLALAVKAETKRVAEIAEATLALAKEVQVERVIVEKSLAYQLALHFIRQREKLEAAQNGNSEQ